MHHTHRANIRQRLTGARGIECGDLVEQHQVLARAAVIVLPALNHVARGAAKTAILARLATAGLRVRRQLRHQSQHVRRQARVGRLRGRFEPLDHRARRQGVEHLRNEPTLVGAHTDRLDDG